MTIRDLIDLRFGGPGSGCNPDVGKCGRPPGSGKNWEDKAPGPNPTSMSKEEYSTGWKTRPNWTQEQWDSYISSPARQEARQRGIEWEQAVIREVSLGRMTVDEARAKGSDMSGEEAEYLPLPEILYHVTGAAPEVEKSGLKTRYELGQKEGHGLGGGTSQAVSFTESLAIAKDIRRGIIEAKQAINGKLSPEKMMAQAKAGTNGKRPWFDEFSKYFEGSHGSISNFLRGVTTDNGTFGESPGLFEYQRGYNWRPVTTSYHWTGGDGKERYSLWERDLTKDEILDKRFEFYKTWSFFRESTGEGPSYPLFFSADREAIASTPINDIQIMKVKRNPGAMGIKLGAGLGEWRTHGSAVTVIGRIIHPKHRIKAGYRDKKKCLRNLKAI
jgi:hypothetical protein